MTNKNVKNGRITALKVKNMKIMYCKLSYENITDSFVDMGIELDNKIFDVSLDVSTEQTVLSFEPTPTELELILIDTQWNSVGSLRNNFESVIINR